MSDDEFQADLFRDGRTFNYGRDAKRLGKQHQTILNLMLDGQPWTLRGVANVTGYGEQSIGARIRDFRKPRFGSHTVITTYVKDGLHTYRLIINADGASASDGASS